MAVIFISLVFTWYAVDVIECDKNWSCSDNAMVSVVTTRQKTDCPSLIDSFFV